MTCGRDFPPEIRAVHRIPGISTLLEAVCRSTGVMFAAIAHVTADRWLACAVEDHAAFGIAQGDTLPLEETLCGEVMRVREPVVIEGVDVENGDYRHRLLAGYGIQSYISVPVFLPDNTFFGTLCGASPKLCDVSSARNRDTFRLFAELIGSNLESLVQLQESRAAFEQEREQGTLREQFMATLSHELRNPLTAIESGLRLMERRPDRAGELIPQIRRVALRMEKLLDQTHDFAEIRLGEGLVLDCSGSDILPAVLAQILEEVRAAFPDCRIDAQLSLPVPVRCDAARVGQILANLLSNAVIYGEAGQPVRVKVTSDARELELSVTNRGEPLPADVTDDLSRPFVCEQKLARHRGLRFGLYIAAEIARAHGGGLTCDTNEETTCFTVRIPTQLKSASPEKGTDSSLAFSTVENVR